MNLLAPLLRRREFSGKPEPQNSIIELIYAGNALANQLVSSIDGENLCLCGTVLGHPEVPENHHNFCPVARFYAAVEAVRKQVL